MSVLNQPLSRSACGWQLAGVFTLLGATAGVHAGLAANGEFDRANPLTVPFLSLAGARRGRLDSAHARVMLFDSVLLIGYGMTILFGCLIAVRIVQGPALRTVLAYGWFAAGANLVVGLSCDASWFIAEQLHAHQVSNSQVKGFLRISAACAIVKFSATAIGGLVAAFGLLLGTARVAHTQKSEVCSDALCPPLPLEQDDLERTGARSTIEALGAMAVPTVAEATTPADGDGDGDGDGDKSRARWTRGYLVPDRDAVVAEAATAHSKRASRPRPRIAMEEPHRHGAIATPPAGAGDLPVPDPAVIGVCLSGGGVRAATLALGALQSAGLRAVLLKARYLVSVSGGGYTAGALQQALTTAVPAQPKGHPADPAPTGRVIRDAASAYLPGTPEEDHLRRHSSYLASTPSELLLAIGLLLRNLVINLALLLAPALVVGIGVGMFYRYIPATPIRLKSASASRAVSSSDMWRVTLVAVGGTLGLAVLLWLLAQIGGSSPRRIRAVALAGARQLTGLALGALVVTVVAAAIVAYTLTVDRRTHIGSHLPITASVGIAVSYLASVLSFVWRKRAAVARAVGEGGKFRRLPTGFVNMLLVVVTLVVLAAAWLLAVGGAANLALEGRPSSSAYIVIGIGAGYIAAMVFLEITTISLHPFYRRQLARTFATRRVRRGGHILAEPYEPSEATSLMRYGLRCPHMPEILFAASASVEAGRTPVGYNRVSYVFGGTWIGGPDVGYIKTDKLWTLCKPQLRRDLTVQGAVAVSGAAIATSVGGQNAQWYETLYTITGVRLGAWLPNPAYIATHYPTSASASGSPGRSVAETWASAGIPRIRRFDYLLRELFGTHAFVAPMLHVSDGGFYDNLGMVELFRRRCTAIYCVDASGDTPPAASTLAQTLTLAREELGVEVDWDPQPWSKLTPGSGEKIAPEDPLSRLNARLSQTGVVRARFTYPDECGVSGLTGVLVVAKAALWRDLPYPLLTYAYGDAAFPHETTANQWFDDSALNAYLELGRELGDMMTPEHQG